MDRERFDAVARALGTTGSRRTALGALLGASIAGVGFDGLARKGKDRGKRRSGGSKGKDSRRERGRGVGAEQVPARCFTGSPCNPGPGRNLTKCDFGGSPTLQNRNLSGANLGKANLANANASGANLNGANLGGACLVEANLTNATVNSSTNFGSAVLCRTIMPNGTTSDAGCNLGTECCPTCDAEHPCPDGELCCGGRCRTRVPVILSGGPDPATPISVDDELDVFLEGNLLADGAGSVGPVSFTARLGQDLQIVATNTIPTNLGLGQIVLHSPLCGTTQTLSSGVTFGSGPLGVFFDQTFEITLGS